jgi:uncharacterized membrane protein YhaH (DUF805 family)
MDWKHLFFSFRGRINRKPFWLGNVAVIGVGWGVLAMVGFPQFARAIRGSTSNRGHHSR